jgi:hypothetical protein
MNGEAGFFTAESAENGEKRGATGKNAREPAFCKKVFAHG